ncbi:hypothetical protein F4Y93_07800 [Candidatus Poribacteria bacterium]|nr:hypothetical protein [Candidatus Poribacteria bacterium]
MRLISLMLCAIFIFVGCGSDETPTPIAEQTPPNYFLDAVGSSWVYRNPDGYEWTREITDGYTTAETDYQRFTYTTVDAEDELDYLKPNAFRVAENRVFFSIGEKVDRYIQDDLPTLVQDEFAGLEINIALEATSHPDFVFFQFPLSPNVEWEAFNTKVNGSLVLQNLVLLQIPIEAHVSIKGKVIAESPIETPAGRFDSAFQIVYEMEFTHTLFPEAEVLRQQQTVWFVPHVGIVKIEDESGITELIAYTFPRTIEA